MPKFGIDILLSLKEEEDVKSKRSSSPSEASLELGLIPMDASSVTQTFDHLAFATRLTSGSCKSELVSSFNAAT